MNAHLSTNSQQLPDINNKQMDANSYQTRCCPCCGARGRMGIYQEYESAKESRPEHSMPDYRYQSLDAQRSSGHSLRLGQTTPELRHLRRGHPILFGAQDINEAHEFKNLPPTLEKSPKFPALIQQDIRPSGVQQRHSHPVRPPTPFEPYRRQMPQRSSISYAPSGRKRHFDNQDRTSVRHERNAQTASAISSLLQPPEDRQIRFSPVQQHNAPAPPRSLPGNTIFERPRSPKHAPCPTSHFRTSSKHHQELQDSVRQTGEHTLKRARQEDSEEDKQRLAYGVAYSILGPLINANTAIIILQLQGTQMHPGQWETIRHVLRTNSKARTDIQCLTLALIARESELQEEWSRNNGELPNGWVNAEKCEKLLSKRGREGSQ